MIPAIITIRWVWTCVQTHLDIKIPQLHSAQVYLYEAVSSRTDHIRLVNNMRVDCSFCSCHQVVRKQNHGEQKSRDIQQKMISETLSEAKQSSRLQETSSAALRVGSRQINPFLIPAVMKGRRAVCCLSAAAELL